MNFRLEADQLIYLSYPFEKQAQKGLGPINSKEISEILPDRTPPEIRTRDREILFVPAEDRERLIYWAQTQQISLSQRPDIWAWLNEPFLDTVFSRKEEELTLQRLEENGISAVEAQGIRKKIQSHMLIYNGFLWEWGHLGHYDVLLSRKKYDLRRLSTNFYQWTMEIAHRNLTR